MSAVSAVSAVRGEGGAKRDRDRHTKNDKRAETEGQTYVEQAMSDTNLRLILAAPTTAALTYD